MKRPLLLLTLALTIFSLLAGCGENTPIAIPTAGTQLERIQTSSPEQEQNIPTDIFGDGFNPFYAVQFPENFNIYAASYSIGCQKFDGKPNYVLSMTAEGKTDEAIAFFAKLAGTEDQSTVDKYICDYNKNAFCEFPMTGGATCTIRKTDPNDDRYPYVEGCHIDLWVNTASTGEAAYLSLFRDNYNVNALTTSANYFNTTPVFGEYSINVNLHKKMAEFSLFYDVEDVGAVQQKMSEELKSNWCDSNSGRMSISYGMIDLTLSFDLKHNGIYVIETTSDMDTPLGSYTAPEVSLATLGFSYSEPDAICIFEDKQNNFSLAIHKPEWGSRNDNWNIEFLQEVNGYLLAVWYNAQEQKLEVQADKGNLSAKYDYFINTGKYSNEYSDRDKVTAHFQTVFNTKDTDVYGKAISLFEQTLEERFGMNMEKLYALPIG